MTASTDQCIFCRGDAPKYTCGQTPLPRTPLELEAKSFDLCPLIVRDAIDGGSEETVCLLSNALLKMIEKRIQLIENGDTAVVRREMAVPESLIKRLTAAMLNACESEDKFPAELLELIRIQLVGSRRWDILGEAGLLVEIGIDDDQNLDRKTKAAMYLAANPEASNRQIALAVGADQSTIGRWRREQEFQRSIGEGKKVDNIGVLYPPTPDT